MFELNLLHTCLERVGQPQRLVRGTENYVFISGCRSKEVTELFML